MSSNESYLVGAILIDGANVLPVVRGLVKPEDFQVEAYRAVFTAAASLAADGEPVDPCSIKARALGEFLLGHSRLAAQRAQVFAKPGTHCGLVNLLSHRPNLAYC